MTAFAKELPSPLRARRRSNLKCQVPFLLLVTSVALGAAAPDRDLDGLRKKIAREKKNLAEIKIKEGSTLRSLGKVESELGRRSRDLRMTKTELSSTARTLASARVETEKIAQALRQRRTALQNRAEALYRWQRNANALPMLEDMEFAARLVKHYLQAALAYDQASAVQLTAANQRQEIVQQELAEKVSQLDLQGQRLGEARQAVHREAEKKRLVLASLRREKESRSQALRDMEAAAERLARMLDQMSRRGVAKPNETPRDGFTGGGLDPLRGKLDWPVNGQVSAPFGKQKHPEFAAEIVRKGIDIDAPSGDAIRAVEKGLIVYAGPFSGYGNMMIIDHGERYYTIYGHLGEILKKKGDTVARGEILARVGDGTARSGAKVYFEMRKDGRSVDPLVWLRNR
jgi:murein hydrolase activator